LLGALVGACAAAAPSSDAPTASPQSSSAPVIAWAAAVPPPIVSSAPVAVASASAPPAPAPIAPSCSGASLTLDAVVADKACAFAGGALDLPPGLAVRIAPTTATVAPGKWLALRATLENTSDRPVVLTLESWGGLGFGGGVLDGLALGTLGSGAKKRGGKPPPVSPPPDPRPAESPGMSTATEDLSGNDLDHPSGGVMGMLGLLQTPPLVRIELSPHGVLTANVAWRAEGYRPGKDYTQRTSLPGTFVIAPPDPLARGTYVVRVRFPMPKLPAAPVKVSVR
jgi:hypothetical protein